MGPGSWRWGEVLDGNRSSSGCRRDSVPERECEIARSGGLEPGSFIKYHVVPGGYDGTVCQRRSAQLRVRLPSQGAWNLVVLQSTMRYRGVQTGVCARGGVLKCGLGFKVLLNS